MKVNLKWGIASVGITAVCVILFTLRSMSKSVEVEEAPLPFAIPASYSCILNPDDAKRLQEQPIVTYWVRRKSPDQIDLVAEVGSWKSVYRFNPSQKPPYVAVCEAISDGVYYPGVMKLTPNSTGGFDFEYLTEGATQPSRGVLRPNWY